MGIEKREEGSAEAGVKTTGLTRPHTSATAVVPTWSMSARTETDQPGTWTKHITINPAHQTLAFKI